MSHRSIRSRPRPAETGAWRRSADSVLRILAAVPGGYGVASLWAMALARLIPGDPAQATITASLIAFALCAGFVMWAYAARTGWRALWTIMLAGAAAGAITMVSVEMTGRS